jgi:hypothetical protein
LRRDDGRPIFGLDFESSQRTLFRPQKMNFDVFSQKPKAKSQFANRRLPCDTTKSLLTPSHIAGELC